MIRRRNIIVCGLMLAFAAAAYGQTEIDPSARCTVLTKLQIPGVALEVTKAEWHAAGKTPTQSGQMAMPPMELPACCRLDGMIDRRVGAKGISYGIGFALALPNEWNGRFLMQGGSGLNGQVSMPLGMAAAGDSPGLARGFAVASTDTGHQSKDCSRLDSCCDRH